MACAILEDGRVECWETDYNQTDGNHARSSWPEGMPRDLGPVQKLMFHSWGDGGCAVLETGALTCWGSFSSTVPADLGPVKDVSLGLGFICALRVDDTVICSDSTSGPTISGCGEGSSCDHPNLIVPDDLEPVQSIQSKMHRTCALTQSNEVRCWGILLEGQPPENLGPVQSLSLGGGNACAVTSGGETQCWQLDLREFGPIMLPDGDGSVIRGETLTAGYFHTCAIQADGKARCWGWNQSRQSEVPEDLGPVKAIAAGNVHTCAIQADGNVRCWGADYIGSEEWLNFGQSEVPEDLGTVQAIAAGELHNCAIMANGNVRCWGNNGGGQNDVPADLGTVQAISAGAVHTCAITDDGNSSISGWKNRRQS